MNENKMGGLGVGERERKPTQVVYVSGEMILF